MSKVLIVVDMQNDFIDGALGTPEAVKIVPAVIKKLENFDGTALFTRDTHGADYLETQEGRNLPVTHCVKGTRGWEIREELKRFIKTEPVDKPAFGSPLLAEAIGRLDAEDPVESIELVGLCTDICVISNALLLKAFFPEIPVSVDPDCCAGVTAGSHENALNAMRSCQVLIE